MKLNVQKRVVADSEKVSSKRVKLDPRRLSEIKEAITKKDLHDLMDEGAIKIVPKKGVSRSRARKHQKQKRKGRRRGPGTREGKAGARADTKETWTKRIRLQRKFLKELKDKEIISNQVYRELYMKAKGGFFRSKRHIKLYLDKITKKK